MRKTLSVLLALLVLAGCSSEPAGKRWAIAIHGGAGVPRGSLDEAEQQAYRASLEEALRVGQRILGDGGSSLDAVEQVLRLLEDAPEFNAGKGAVFTRAGEVELDASIMDGATLDCGAVAGVRTVRNPISLARKVMEQSRHVLLAGEGAESFADEVGVARVDRHYFFTQRRWDALQRALQSEQQAGEQGTVGAVALDLAGNLAAGTSTGGLTAKWPGRVGDSPIIGAGTYADNRSCAVSCTGKGEEFIRRAVAFRVAALIEGGEHDLQKAADRVVHELLRPGDGGLIAVDAHGAIAMTFNTPGMFRAAADSGGRFETGIWE